MKAMSCETFNNDMPIALTRRLLLILNTWEHIVGYLDQHGDLPVIANPNRRRQLQRTLLDMDTYIVATSLVLRQLQGGKTHSLNELANVLQADNESLRNSAKQKLRDIILPRVGDHYGLFEYSKPDDPWNGQQGYQIYASDRLISFFHDVVFPNLETPATPEQPEILRKHTLLFCPKPVSGELLNYVGQFAM